MIASRLRGGGRWQAHLAMAVAALLAVAVTSIGGRVPVEEVTLAGADTTGGGRGPSRTGSEVATPAGELVGNDEEGPDDASGPSAPGGPTRAPGAGPGGGAASGAPGTAAGPGRQDPGVTADTIRVGGSTFTSGPAAVYGEQMAVGFTAGVQYVNDSGGVNGRNLALTLYDDGGDPAKQLANTKRLVEVDEVFALTMVYAPIAGEYVASAGVPVVHGGQYDEEFTNPWWFPLGGPQRTAAFQLERYVADHTSTKKVAIFYVDMGASNFSSAYIAEVQDDWRRYGVDASVVVPFAPDQTSCSDAISKASSAGVDFIQLEIDAARVINCGVEAQLQGYKPPQGWGGYLIGVPVVPQALGSIAEGMVAFDAFGALYDAPVYTEYVKRVSPRTEARSSVTMTYFLAALLLRDGLEQLGEDLTREGLRNVLNTFTDWRPGLTDHPNQPSWTWTPTCHTALQGGYAITVQKDGGSYQWKQVTDQLLTTPLPPGKGIPPGFESCSHIFRSAG